MKGALDGIRVLDLGLLVQGPQAAALLCAMGADVIKIELPVLGEYARRMAVSPDDPRSAYFTACNRGKRSITLDIRIPAGAEVFRKLAAVSDVVVSNFKPGTLEAWGLGYDALAADNPGLIWAAGSAYGPLGDDALREGVDLAAQAAGGLISTTGRDGEPPTPVGVTIADHIASQNLAAGILAALVARGCTGRGQRVEVSLLGGQIWAQACEYSHFLMTGRVPGRANFGHPLLKALYRIFETADGWLGLTGVPPAAKDAFFIAIDRPELAFDPRFETLRMQPHDLEWLLAELTEIFRTRTTEAWCRTFREAGVRHAPVRDYREVVADPGAWINGYFAEVDDGTGTMERVVGTPIRMSETPLAPAARTPALGADTEAVLRELGYATADLERLRELGAL